MDDLTWLKKFCSTDERRPQLMTPWTTLIDGELWTGATNGAALVLIRQGSEAPSWSYGEPVWAAPLARHVKHVVAFKDLVAGVLAGVPKRAPKCRACRGTGTMHCKDCHGSGECMCHRCEDTHMCRTCGGEPLAVTCDVCLGAKVSCGPDRPITFYGITVDRLLFRALRHLSAEAVDVMVLDGESPIHLLTPDWRLLVMPMRRDPDPERPVFPAVTVHA